MVLFPDGRTYSTWSWRQDSMHHPCYAITCIEENGIDADDIFSTAEEGYLTLITHVSSSGVLRCRTSGIEIQPNCIIYNGCRRKSQDFCCYVSGKLLETRLALVSLQTWRRVWELINRVELGTKQPLQNYHRDKQQTPWPTTTEKMRRSTTWLKAREPW